MNKQKDCDCIKVLVKGPPIVYLVKKPVELFSIAVITSKSPKNKSS